MDLNELSRARVVFNVPGMELARVRKDLIYQTVDGNPLKLDLWYPVDAEEGKPLPAVILVHGEWPPEIMGHSKDLGPFVSLAQLIAASGLIAVNFNHRSTEQLTRLHDAAGDVSTLITYVHDNATHLGVDPDHLCVWVFSAGMPIGLSAAMRGVRDGVRCIVSYYGLMDLLSVRDRLPPYVSEADLREFSALEYMRAHPEDVPPIFIAKAGLDRPGLNRTIDLFVEEAGKLAVPVEMMEHEHGKHGFDVWNDDERSREIIKRTLKFMQENI